MNRLPQLLLVAAIASSACRKNDDAPNNRRRDDPDTETTPTGETGSTPTGETGNTPTGDTAPEIPYDCAALPTPPFTFTELDSPRGYHGLAIDPDGYLIGNDASGNLLKVSYDNIVTPFVPGIGTLQGMDWLLDGDLVAAAGNRLVRISPAGAVTTLATLNNVYGVVVAPNGMVYAADRNDVWRVDPETGESVRFVATSGQLEAQSLGFSPDYSKMYIASNFGYALWEMDLDENFEPLSAPTQLADFGQSYRDGLAVDWCGNIYVPDYGTNNLYRVSPEGNVQRIVDFSFSKYGHGIIFGSGVGGWKIDSIYLPQPYDGNTVVEIDIGVPESTWVP